MNRLDDLLKMPRSLTPAEEEEGKRLWAEKNGKPYEPRRVVDQEALDRKYGVKEWRMEFCDGKAFQQFPHVKLWGPPLGMYCIMYGFPDDWEGKGHLIPDEWKQRVRDLFDEHAVCVPVDSMHGAVNWQSGPPYVKSVLREKEQSQWATTTTSSMRRSASLSTLVRLVNVGRWGRGASLGQW